MTEVNQTSPRGATGRPPKRRRSELERLLDRTVLGPTHPELGSCWQFTGTCTPYGRMAKAQDSYTHRLGWKLLRGPIPEDRELHHRCGVYACWNPDHLQIVTHAENLAFKRQTHCKHGHPLSGENLRIDPRTGARVCRPCLRESQRQLRARARRKQEKDLGPGRNPGQPGRPPGRPHGASSPLRNPCASARTASGSVGRVTQRTSVHFVAGQQPSGQAVERCGQVFAMSFYEGWAGAAQALSAVSLSACLGILASLPKLADNLRYVNQPRFCCGG